MISSLKRRSRLGVLSSVALVLLVPIVSASDAQGAKCDAGSEASVSTIHTSCAEATAVLGKAIKKIPAPRFRVYVHGWWHCSYSEVGGYPTLTAERKYGTPQRQVVIVVN